MGRAGAYRRAATRPAGRARRRLFARVELAAELEDLVIARLSPTFGYVPERASHPAQLAV
jgi:hypothetical protein